MLTPDELEAERQRWNQAMTNDVWRQTRFNSQPNALLVAAVQHRPPGLALDVHMGEGRNALYLARSGWQVTGIDIADQALALARQQALEQGLSLTTVVEDATRYDWGISAWDLVLLCYADEKDHADDATLALRPGGLVVLENFHTDVNQARGLPPGQTIGFATNQLRQRYQAAGFHILHYEEPLAVADFSLETQRLVRLIAQKM